VNKGKGKSVSPFSYRAYSSAVTSVFVAISSMDIPEISRISRIRAATSNNFSVSTVVAIVRTSLKIFVIKKQTRPKDASLRRV
jgi:hypothetical protein